MNHFEWPELAYSEWAPTKKTLHMCTQMLGKTRLGLAPPQPEWLHACLHVGAHGFTTGPMPDAGRIVSAGLDVFHPRLWVRVSDGREEAVPLDNGRSVAEIWRDYRDALGKLGIELDLWEKPQEVADTTPFSVNTHDRTLLPEQMQRFYSLLASVVSVLEEFRSSFFGRSGIQFWWGTFDLAVLLFTGKKLTAPEDRGYIMRYDLDAEHLNAGFWAGDDDSPQPGFYGYIIPEPPGCANAVVEPPHANWTEAMREWILPYDDVRATPDPRRAILDFLNSVYRVAVAKGEWNAEGFEYTRPPKPARV